MKKGGESLKEFEEKIRELMHIPVADIAAKERIWNNIKKKLEVSQNEK